MGRDLSLPDRLHAFGIPFDLYPGWDTAGPATVSTSEPFLAVTHHTAGSPVGIAPSLGGIAHGFPGAAPPPLANILQTRAPDGNDRAIVVASGKSNNAGVGTWHGLSGNSRTRGLEIEHTGVTPLPEVRLQRAAQIQAAVLWGSPIRSADYCCQHWEYATPPGRKIDVSTDPITGRKLDGGAFRARVAHWLAWKAGHADPPPAPPAPPVPQEGTLMWIIKVVDKEHPERSSYVLLGPGVMANISDAAASDYHYRARYPLDNGPGSQGYDPLYAIARAKELGAWTFTEVDSSPPAEG